MFPKAVVIFLAQVLIQQISCQCIGAYNGYADGLAWGAPCAAAPYSAAPWEVAAPYTAAAWEFAPYAAAPYATAPYAPCAPDWNAAALAASHGPGLAVTSASPVPPIGVTTVSENAVSGGLAVAGQVPFLSAIVLEGTLPTVGAGAIAYGCGNGNVAILNEDVAPVGYSGYMAAPYEVAYGAPYGYGAGPLAGPYGYGGCGCGCGAIY